MASILQQIGTPLQLIALFLLLVAGVARVLVRSGKWNPSPAITRLVINRIFQAAIVALVIGIVGPAMSPALDRWLNSDETFHGAVLSTTGEAIAGASVNLITVATVSTNPLGQFEITVPRNRTLDEYKLQVSAPGYEISPVMTRSPAELKNAEIRLTPAADPELVKGIEPTVMVGQFLGYPFALVTLRVENDGDSLLSINQIQGRLSGNDTAFVLAPMSWTIAGIFGPFAPVTGPFPIFAGTKLDLRVVMMPGANLASLYNQLGALPEYANQAPCTPKFNGTVDPLTSEAFEIVKTFSEDRFGWREGGWTLQLEVSAEGEDKKTFEHEFAISESDLNRLRTSLRLAKSCLGVHFTAPLAQDGSVANFLSK